QQVPASAPPPRRGVRAARAREGGERRRFHRYHVGQALRLGRSDALWLSGFSRVGGSHLAPSCNAPCSSITLGSLRGTLVQLGPGTHLRGCASEIGRAPSCATRSAALWTRHQL